jgi:hypothetical protein
MAAMDDLGPDSDPEFGSPDEATKQALLSSDREAQRESSPIVLKSFTALSKSKAQTPRSTSPTPTSDKPVMDDSETGKLCDDVPLIALTFHTHV